MTFEERLKAKRIANNMTQKDVAEKIGVQVRHYQQLEYGKYKPGFENLLALADLFNISLDEFLGRKNFSYRQIPRETQKKILACLHITGNIPKDRYAALTLAMLELHIFPVMPVTADIRERDSVMLVEDVIEKCDYFVMLVGEGGINIEENYSYRYAVQEEKTGILLVNGQYRELIPASETLCVFMWEDDNLEWVARKAFVKLIHKHPPTGWVRSNELSAEQMLVELELRRKIESLEEHSQA
jgi:transcriptional regulator with XRE-family HTH domain